MKKIKVEMTIEDLVHKFKHRLEVNKFSVVDIKEISDVLLLTLSLSVGGNLNLAEGGGNNMTGIEDTPEKYKLEIDMKNNKIIFGGKGR